MVSEVGPRDTDQKSVEPAEGQLLISWRLLVAGCVLALFSLIDEWQVTENLKVSGGVTLAALAAVILFWPLVRQITVRGGEIDLKNLRLKVNEIQNEAQRIENDNAMKIQELESEIGDLRSGVSIPANEEGRTSNDKIPTMENDVSVLEWAVMSYTTAVPLEKFQKRVEIDKEIVRCGRHLSFAALGRFLESQNRSSEAQMAVAVALGLAPPNDEQIERARLLSELMNSSSERVRARAGIAAKRWGERRTTSEESRSILLSACARRLLEESPTSGARVYLEKAQEVLSATLFWSDA